MTEKEIRSISSTLELRAAEGSEKEVITGYALKFNRWSSVLGGWFKEIIDPRALDQADMTNVVALFNHDESKVLAHFNPRTRVECDGPAVNPSFSIGGNIYQVNGTLLAGERFVINQLENKVTKITNSGEVINAFNLRSKTYSVFEPIPTGESLLTYTGEFAISLNLFYERGEPRWN